MIDIQVLYPFEGTVTEDRVKMAASDCLANEQNLDRGPDDIDIWEAIDICEYYGYYSFVEPIRRW